MWSALAAAALIAFAVPEGVSKTPFVVSADDGTTLYGVEYRDDPKHHRRTVIIVGDGFDGTDMDDVDGLAQALFLRGLDVIVWDRRGTGRSQGHWDYGASDEVDLFTIVRAADSRTFGREIGIYGIGSGGEAALRVAAQTAKVQAVAVYGVGVGGAGERWTTLTHPQSFPGKLLLRLRGVRPGPFFQPPQGGAPLKEAVKKMRRRAVFVSVGGQADRVSRDDALELYQAAYPPKEWGFAPTAGDTPPTALMASQVVDFFVRRLR